MTDSKVIRFPNAPPEPMSAAKILAEAAGAGLSDCMVIGWNRDGEMYFSSTTSEGPEVLWLVEQAKFALLEMGRPE